MKGLYLAMYGDSVSITQALFISFFAMAVVFVVLLIISYLIDATAFCLNRSNKKSVPENKVPAMDVDTNKKDDTVVVIAAAIASYMGTTVDNIRISKIRRIQQNSSPWIKK